MLCLVFAYALLSCKLQRISFLPKNFHVRWDVEKKQKCICPGFQNLNYKIPSVKTAFSQEQSICSPFWRRNFSWHSILLSNELKMTRLTHKHIFIRFSTLHPSIHFSQNLKLSVFAGHVCVSSMLYPNRTGLHLTATFKRASTKMERRKWEIKYFIITKLLSNSNNLTIYNLYKYIYLFL